MKIQGAGLGLRREMLPSLLPDLPDEVDFWELAPENWIPMGGKFARQLRECTSQATIIAHGLSLSIGSPDPLDVSFVKAVKAFLDEHEIQLYSEHLSYCSAEGHLYDLLPVPFTGEAVKHVSARIKQVQDIIERPLVLENVSYYLKPHGELDELEFITAVLEEADCQMLLDVNNLYVNSINHCYDPRAFLQALPSSRIALGHIAGHFDESETLKIDTHGDAVCEPVWSLLEQAYEIHGVFPTLLERDFNLPPLTELLTEVSRIKAIQHAASGARLPQKQRYEGVA